MSSAILATKLYIPLLRPKVVLRLRLLERLNEGLHRKLTLIAADGASSVRRRNALYNARLHRKVAGGVCAC
jgi:hypothetical protein